jgi:type II secretory pathway pseudopilin PulG
MKGAAAALEQSRRVYGPGGSHENQADWISAQLTYHRDQAEYAASLNAARATYGPGTAYYNTALADATAKNKTPVVPPEWASAQAAYNKAMLTAKEAEDKAQAKVSPGALEADTHLKTSMHGLATEFDNLRTSMIPTMSDFLDSLAKAAPYLMPFVKASVGVAGGFINTLSSGMQSSGFKTFMGDMTADVTPIMQDFATWTENAGATFGKFLELFGGAPAQAVGSWFDRTSARLLAAFGHPAVKGHLEGGKMVGAEGATGFFRDVNVQAMDRTFDAMGKLFGTTAQAVGKLLIAAEPVAGMVAGLVLDFDHLVLALPKWFLTDFMKVAATFVLIKTLLPSLAAGFGAMNIALMALSIGIAALMPVIMTFLKAIGAEHDAQNAEKALNQKLAAAMYKKGDVTGMSELALQVQRNAKVATGTQRSQLQEEAEYYAWAAHQMAAGKSIANFGQFTTSTSNASLVDRMWGSVVSGVTGGSGPQVTVHVYVGGKEITDLVDTRIEHNNKKVATRVRSGKR